MSVIETPKLKNRFKSQEEFERTFARAWENAKPGFETELLSSMKDKYDRFGMDMFLSEKQEVVLDRIAYPEESDPPPGAA